MCKVSSIANALQGVDAGLSISNFLGGHLKKLIPKFLYRNPYYFEEVNKKVFVRKNGDGVVVCACDLCVINPDKVEDFVRFFDISDAPKSTTFPKFKKFCKQRTFFEDFSFWFKSEHDIITEVEEYSGDKLSTDDKEKIKSQRLLAVKFLVDKSKLKENHKYRIIYGYSAPKLFPINNGKHDSTDYKRKEYEYCTSAGIKHMAKQLRLSVYLENGISIHEAPHGYATKAIKSQAIPPTRCEIRDNILYTKYLYTIKRPEKYSKISIKWKLK